MKLILISVIAFSLFGLLACEDDDDEFQDKNSEQIHNQIMCEEVGDTTYCEEK